MARPNILFILTDQQRYDTISALGNEHIHTPNFDRLVRKGVSFTNAYSTCPVCMPARYTIRTGCEPPRTRIFSNNMSLSDQESHSLTTRCGPYLAETMKGRGYRTFGIGKFHSRPWDEDLGYETHLHSEEMYSTPEQRKRDAYAQWIAQEHPEYDFVEMLMGERSEMYYMPQMSPLPADLGVESWATDRAIEQISAQDSRPFFGVVSYIGPHPPLAPPLPYNRMYDPDSMPPPSVGTQESDHLDEYIPYVNYRVFAEDIGSTHAKILKSRYYGEISYIDHCLGRLLDSLEANEQTANTLICFTSDHGDQMGDHNAWQKESFFDASCKIPFIVSQPGTLPENTRNEQLVCLTDLFGLATTASGEPEVRDGINILNALHDKEQQRSYLIGYHGTPGSNDFKAMVRKDEWKYIFMANGGLEQLFNLKLDPNETDNLCASHASTCEQLKTILTSHLQKNGPAEAIDNGKLLAQKHTKKSLSRAYQFDRSRVGEPYSHSSKK
ncbi:sulfatase-like hydrolase/transferase [Coraliomargarita sp. SDUM461004]|uniref:Sulfatase-like hydrolase/transferase n=1 Tax=Thalassobacterium sedimentorum TaxID=3041258 RepID=A0ABU1ADQ3_9BACT|nr:sulfatase-like hydrolase/transferase [Coraliomargarita sp. SDUM461004]MDQ8192822.1 sulfatase-like hydrolase/transferase [Coraliomargarita sp. SDUM461004]